MICPKTPSKDKHHQRILSYRKFSEKISCSKCLEKDFSYGVFNPKDTNINEHIK